MKQILQKYRKENFAKIISESSEIKSCQVDSQKFVLVVVIEKEQ